MMMIVSIILRNHSPQSFLVIMPALKPLTIGVLSALTALSSQAQTTDDAVQTVVVSASADASAAGLSKTFAGGQVAKGGRVGLLGTMDIMDTPFNSTNYTQQFIQDQQAHSVADDTAR